MVDWSLSLYQFIEGYAPAQLFLRLLLRLDIEVEFLQ